MPRHGGGSTGNAGGRAPALVPGWRGWEWHRVERGRQQPPLLGSGTRSHLCLSGGHGGWGIPASQGHWQLPGSALGMCTARTVSPVPEHGHSAGLPFPGEQGWGRTGKHIQSPGPPSPRLWSRTGAEVCMGNESGPALWGWGHPDTPESRDLMGCSHRATVPECSAGAGLCQACHRRRVKPSLCLLV